MHDTTTKPTEFIPIQTPYGTYMVYRYSGANPNGNLDYLRYDDLGIRVFKSPEACQRACDKLNGNANE